jgi:UDP-N-acetylmuramoyl-L-alanyl-D-glutamate--2,6-diaminopimelate ligase
MQLQSLVDLLRPSGLLVRAPADDPVIGGLAVDSREIVPGALFLALPGAVADGHDFVARAAQAGAVAAVVERTVDAAVPQVEVRDARRAAELLAAAWFHHPAESLRLVGVTGTNGKTTTTAILRHLLGNGADAGSIGTLGAFDGSGATVRSTAGTLTTPGPVDLQQTLRGLVDRGVTWVAMEASSHALAQRRLDALSFAAGVFTNLTRDHLDYHGEMDAYLAAKLRLAELVRPDGVLSVNADDPAWAPLHRDARLVTWGSAAGADLRVTDVDALALGSRFTVDGRFGTADVSLPLPGDFNVSNALAAMAAVLGLGTPLAEVVRRIATAPQVPGRLERILDAPFHVVRDYAHTPDALERLLATVRPITPGRVILVFGCGGDRDKGKRPVMGGIAGRGADVVIVTSDNPRTEDPDAIIDDIVAGMRGMKFQREADRHVAIGTALSQARPGDLVVLAGKGHEDYQVIGSRREPFDERLVVRGLMGR